MYDLRKASPEAFNPRNREDQVTQQSLRKENSVLRETLEDICVRIGNSLEDIYEHIGEALEYDDESRFGQERHDTARE